MGSILYSRQTDKGTKHTLAGIVTAINENKDDKHPLTVNVRCGLYDADSKSYVRRTVSMQTWVDSSYSQIERIKNMKLQVGSFIVCSIGNLKEYTPRSGDPIIQAILFNISYGDLRMVDQNKGLVVITGRVGDIVETSEKTADVTVTVTRYNPEEHKRYNEDYVVTCGPKVYPGLKKIGLVKGGTMSVLGKPEGLTMTAMRAEFGVRPKDGDKASE